MKTNLLLVLSIALGISNTTIMAQVTSGVPGYISYQGRVLDSTGAAVGVGTPVNRTITFRVWDHPSNTLLANLIYSEEQTVTISDGEFSVLVGQGVATTNPIGDPETSLGPPNMSIANAFNGVIRYLGVTVDDGDGGTVDNEVSPRQQIVSSAYAYRAKYAETLGTSQSTALTVLDSGNIGVGTSTPVSKLDVAGGIRAAGTNVGLSLADSGGSSRATLGVAAGPGAYSSSAGTNDAVLRAEPGGKLHLQSGSGSAAITIDTNNRVGIGTAPDGNLDVSGYLRVQGASTATGIIALGNRWTGPNYYDTGIFRGGVGSLAAGNSLNLAAYDGIAFNTSAAALGSQATRLFIRGSDGHVGIGKTNPSGRLHVYSTSTQDALNIERAGLPYWCHFSNGANGDHYLRSGSGVGKVILQDTGGNVGIGTSTPSAKLYVYSTISPVDTAIFHRPGQHASHIHNGSNGDVYWRSGSGAGKVILQDTGGAVGIGTSSPTQAKLVVHGVAGSDSLGNHATFHIGGASGQQNGAWTLSDISIKATNGIHCDFVRAFSDARIKNIEGRSDGVADLITLNQIEITDYTHKDFIDKGKASRKMVIAQQVEMVFPQAVAKTVDVIPDVYKMAPASKGWVTFDHDFKKGDRVRLISTKKDDIFEVLEVKKDRFRTEFIPEDEDSVFVFGREVDDFRTVDYNAIAMLNVSATQQIKKEKDAEISALKSENAALRERLEALEEADKARDSRLSAIEKMLTTNGIATVAVESGASVK